jgi:hypothetical protein
MFVNKHNIKIPSVPPVDVLFVFTELCVTSSECGKIVSFFEHENECRTANTYVRMYVCMYVCVCVCIMYVCMYVCMYGVAQ